MAKLVNIFSWQKLLPIRYMGYSLLYLYVVTINFVQEEYNRLLEVCTKLVMSYIYSVGVEAAYCVLCLVKDVLTLSQMHCFFFYMNMKINSWLSLCVSLSA